MPQRPLKLCKPANSKSAYPASPVLFHGNHNNGEPAFSSYAFHLLTDPVAPLGGPAWRVAPPPLGTVSNELCFQWLPWSICVTIAEQQIITPIFKNMVYVVYSSAPQSILGARPGFSFHFILHFSLISDQCMPSWVTSMQFTPWLTVCVGGPQTSSSRGAPDVANVKSLQTLLSACLYFFVLVSAGISNSLALVYGPRFE